eukprot:TRINITY_DN42355_c0_g1_i2.p2 TRINITY_DN42355_c0_g1~~TRINITY_DN42355_c0_g1_i2.p2  ORF type:complete len:250 (-),score=73.55 TRINITY_DN42355_c0_g1_i2:37-765(-)
MKSVVLLFVLLVVSSWAAEPKEEENVAVLDPSNFDDWVNAQDYTLVEFYAPWCGHCKHLAPEWAKAAAKAKTLDPPIKIAKVDADAHRELATRFSVQGYPTILSFRKGVKGEYNGPRQADGIVQYIKRDGVPPHVHVHTVEETEALFKANEIVVVGFFREPVAASGMYKTFTNVAADLRGEKPYAFAYSAESGANAVAQNFKVKLPKVVAFVKNGAEQIVCPLTATGFNEEALKKWLEESLA